MSDVTFRVIDSVHTEGCTPWATFFQIEERESSYGVGQVLKISSGGTMFQVDLDPNVLLPLSDMLGRASDRASPNRWSWLVRDYWKGHRIPRPAYRDGGAPDGLREELLEDALHRLTASRRPAEKEAQLGRDPDLAASGEATGS